MPSSSRISVWNRAQSSSKRCQSGEGVVLALNGKSGQSLVWIGSKGGSGRIKILDPNGQDLVWLGMTEEKTGAVIASDPSGKREAVRLTPE